MDKAIHSAAIIPLPGNKNKTLQMGLDLQGALALLPVDRYSRFLEHVAAARHGGMDRAYVLAVLLAHGLEQIEVMVEQIAADGGGKYAN